MIDYSTAIDWLSIKLNGLCVALAVISGNQFLGILAGIATASTIIYNGIRIYKEVKKNK